MWSVSKNPQSRTENYLPFNLHHQSKPVNMI
nr:MAG TPA: hypothetical protein [Caudoviricetes sp.]